MLLCKLQSAYLSALLIVVVIVYRDSVAVKLGASNGTTCAQQSPLQTFSVVFYVKFYTILRGHRAAVCYCHSIVLTAVDRRLSISFNMLRVMPTTTAHANQIYSNVINFVFENEFNQIRIDLIFDVRLVRDIDTKSAAPFNCNLFRALFSFDAKFNLTSSILQQRLYTYLKTTSRLLRFSFLMHHIYLLDSP